MFILLFFFIYDLAKVHFIHHDSALMLFVVTTHLFYVLIVDRLRALTFSTAIETKLQ